MSDYYTFEIKCPYCKKANDVTYMTAYDGDVSYTCDHCFKKFIIEMTFKVKKV